MFETFSDLESHGFSNGLLLLGISMKKFNHVIKLCERFQMKENAT